MLQKKNKTAQKIGQKTIDELPNHENKFEKNRASRS